MNEWGVYLVVASLLTTAVLIGRPIVALTRTNTKLECAVDKLTETADRFDARMRRFQQENRDSHTRIWRRVDAQDVNIARHEIEIKHLNGGKTA